MEIGGDFSCIQGSCIRFSESPCRKYIKSNEINVFVMFLLFRLLLKYSISMAVLLSKIYKFLHRLPMMTIFIGATL